MTHPSFIFPFSIVQLSLKDKSFDALLNLFPLQNWTYMTSERRAYYPNTVNSGPFYLQMGMVEQMMGTVQVYQ